MKDFYRILMYTIFGILLVMASYIIIINIYHSYNLSKTIIVSETDTDYITYKDNIILIEEFINKHTVQDNKLYLSLTKVLNSMKTNGICKLTDNTKLNNKDLYELNDYFMEELINNGWVSTLREYDLNNNQDLIKELVDNSNYLNNILTNNSLVLSDSKIDDNYHSILTNYMMYSKVILNMCNELGGINE